MTSETDTDRSVVGVPGGNVVIAGTSQAKQRHDTLVHRTLFAAVLAFLASEVMSQGTLGSLAGMVLVAASSFVGFKAVRRSEFVLPAKCRAFVDAVGELVDSHIRRLSVSRIDADLLEQLSPEMLEQLRQDGLRTAVVVIPLVMLGAFSATSWLFGHIGIGAIEGKAAVVYWVVMIGVLILSFPATLRGHLDREIKFHRQHGKWRWER
jgi:hypothetical protein